MAADVEFMEKPVDVKKLLEKIRKLSLAKEHLILVVEDDELSRNLLTQAIEKTGWKTLVAEDGKDALIKLETQEPTLILLDLMMPNIDGFDVIKEIQQHRQWKKIPIIVITAKALTTTEREFLNQYTQDLFLKKAYSWKNFVSAIIDRIKLGKR